MGIEPRPVLLHQHIGGPPCLDRKRALARRRDVPIQWPRRFRRGIGGRKLATSPQKYDLASFLGLQVVFRMKFMSPADEFGAYIRPAPRAAQYRVHELVLTVSIASSTLPGLLDCRGEHAASRLFVSTPEGTLALLRRSPSFIGLPVDLLYKGGISSSPIPALLL